MIPLPIQDVGGDAPCDRVRPHIAKIGPGKRLAKFLGDFPLF